MPFTIHDGRGALRTNLGRPCRTIAIGYASMALGFYAVTHLPLAEAMALSFTRPLFLVVLAVIFLGESVRWRRWSATGVGFLGVLVMARPGDRRSISPRHRDPGRLPRRRGRRLLKRLSTIERPQTIIFYFTIFARCVAAPALWSGARRMGCVRDLVLLGGSARSANICHPRLPHHRGDPIEPVDYVSC